MINIEQITENSASDYARIAEAIRYLHDHADEQPTLEVLADHLSLSPFHLQRLFKRWAGVSPKRFVQYLTLAHARSLLAKAHSTLDTAYAVGLSSPSRLHDLFVSTEAITPAEFRNGGAGLEICYGFHATPFGEAFLAITERGICGLHFVPGGQQAAVLDRFAAGWPHARFSRADHRTGLLITQIFSLDALDQRRPLTLLLKGTNFQVKVWEALLRIPPASAVTYGDIARHIGSPRASQAVGQAVSRNEIAFLIPCHRVIRSTGIVSDYRWGATRKKALLAWESAREQASNPSH